MLPEDFKIGPLGDVRGGAPDQGKAVETVDKFLGGLVAGTVDKSLLAEETRATVADAVRFGLDKGDTPTSFRVGRPRTRDDGEVTAAVRLFGHDSSAEGEIYVAKSGEQWLVSDLQINMAQLSVKTDKPKEKFFPLDYRWLLEE
ncbi:MAG TPA: hypothetical protein VFI08_10985 [Spirochaetia bacterium]|nr:hypothetical protein [Spirochaetia bacterium]